MRMLMNVKIPNEPFNTLMRSGSAGKTIQKILEAVKPEAAYFTEHDGNRGAVLVLDVKDPSAIPSLSEPWFLSFNATCSLRMAMTIDDLQRSGLDEIVKDWS